ncbi:hypothetical protein ACIQMJ_15265 [Actinosynnema sp. NPDC091369]
MAFILIALAVVSLVVYGLERNHRRQPHLGSRLAGSADVEDRDLVRVAADVRVAATHPTPARATRHRAVTSARVSPAC